MDDGILLKKKYLVIGALVFLALFGIASFLILYNGPSQAFDEHDQDPQLEFAVEGSKIAGIQVLLKDGGLSSKQYTKVFEVLNKELPELEPSSRYFVLVEDSMKSISTRDDEVYDISPYEFDEDVDESDLEEEYIEPSERVEMEFVDTLVFVMRSESDTDYKVSVYTAGGTTEAEVTIEKQ